MKAHYSTFKNKRLKQQKQEVDLDDETGDETFLPERINKREPFKRNNHGTQFNRYVEKIFIVVMVSFVTIPMNNKVNKTTKLT